MRRAGNLRDIFAARLNVAELTLVYSPPEKGAREKMLLLFEGVRKKKRNVYSRRQTIAYYVYIVYAPAREPPKIRKGSHHGLLDKRHPLGR